ncbi:hypothetical protein KDA14_05445, partial [Candidatus Saccharibacteria bacterium]|nr:hypothetical protein [Candidatus Saccharibacteria bacterium]
EQQNSSVHAVIYTMAMRSIVLIAHDIRSTHNVGSLFRTAECMGVERLYLTGYTPHPGHEADDRLPHIVRKLEKDIEKTALGTTSMVDWSYKSNVQTLISHLKDDGYHIVALEQHDTAIALPDYSPPEKVALLLGREVEGIDPTLLSMCDDIVEIPQFGQKESLNVVQAAAIAMYHLRFAP